MKKLRELSGFGWDDANKLVVAPVDVWDKYLEVCLHFRPTHLPTPMHMAIGPSRHEKVVQKSLPSVR